LASAASSIIVPKVRACRTPSTSPRSGWKSGSGEPAQRSTRTGMRSARRASSARNGIRPPSRVPANPGEPYRPAKWARDRAPASPRASRGRASEPSIRTSREQPVRGGGSPAAHRSPPRDRAHDPNRGGAGAGHGVHAGVARSRSRSLCPGRAARPQADLVPVFAAAPTPLVCLDPGHGTVPAIGRQTEPIGPGSSIRKVKDGGGAPGEAPVALAIALRTRALLQRDGYRVAMTRTGPTYAGGNIARARFCNVRHAALMIRIHADGSSDPSRHGVKTLLPALHPRWTDDIYARRLPARRAGPSARPPNTSPE